MTPASGSDEVLPSGATLQPAGGVAAPRLGALEARFPVTRLLGRGGTAQVYLVTDPVTGQQVALKVMRPDVSAIVGEARFQREIAIARALKHPNILPVIDSGASEGQLYYSMPYVANGTLRDRLLTERQLSVGDAIAIARSVARAVDHAHGQGVLHRDIKPANILLDGDTAILADFGIARAISPPEAARLTESGVVIGTPEYMSPEQGGGSGKLDVRSDLYALGCVVYEMLAGEPPFTGPTMQAVIARHCYEEPRSLRIVRPEVPAGVERVIRKALAKVPADRYNSAAEFIEALERGTTEVEVPSRAWWRRRSVAAVAVLLMAVAALILSWLPNAPLDPNRIVVFPLSDQGGADQAAGGDGEAVATFMGYALDETRPLQWLDGWELLRADGAGDGERVDQARATRLSRRAGAAYYVDGSIIRRPDSVTVIVRLTSVEGDSLVRLQGAAGPARGASLPQLGLEAMRGLLPDLVKPGGRIDLTSLTGLRPAVVANFLQGEREYRRMQFGASLDHYSAALGEDSTLGLAALRGAQAATWLSDLPRAAQLANLAVSRPSVLAASQRPLAIGLQAYLSGAADTAMRLLQQAVAQDSMSHTAWTVLGEVYSRLLPAVPAADSLAGVALARARQVDADFAPALLLLEERALRAGNVNEALRLRAALRRAGADTTHARSRQLMLRCVEQGEGTVDWRPAASAEEPVVLSSGLILGGRAAQSACALSAFRAVLARAEASRGGRWGAFLGMQAQLAASGRTREMTALFKAPTARDLPLRFAYLLLATAGYGLDAEAGAIADSTVGAYAQRPGATLWYLGAFEARRGNLPRVREIADILRARADSSGRATDALLARAIAARVPLLEADTASAIARLDALDPVSGRRDIGWEPWASMGPERLLLAELLAATGRLDEALRVARQLDATEPVIYPLYLRRSLELRQRIAESTGDRGRAQEYRRRLAVLGGS